MESLSMWLPVQAPSGTVCLRARGESARDELLDHVAALTAALQEFEPGRWLLCTGSSYACAVGLLALWQAGCTAVLPPNLEVGSLRELAPGARGLVSDCAVQPEGLRLLSALEHPHASRPSWSAIDPDRIVLELCTSGSTGARKRHPKSLRQLDTEIAELERLFGAECGRARVLGTVSHQHIYGLLFRVLWPLCARRTFVDLAITDPGEIARGVESADAVILVSSPAHLGRLPELIDLPRLRAACREVFSSGGPIDEGTATRYQAALGRAPLEVLGSTETGGIAWRRQGSSPSTRAWTPFGGACIEVREGLLHVRSPQAGAGEGVTTGDSIELLEEGRFLLLGRADRIVKLFDERISLAEIESRLCKHPWVDAAAALTIERNGTPRIAAAVVLKPSAELPLPEPGRAALVGALQSHLRDYFRATALPRSWRFVERLPEDAQGKRNQQELQALFSKAAPSRSARLLEQTSRGERELEVGLEVPDDLWCLAGHFEGMPVVPGVVQLQWVLDWTGSWLRRELRLREVEALKFKQVLGPGTRFQLRLEYAPEQDKIRFRMWNESGEFSTGRLLFETVQV